MKVLLYSFLFLIFISSSFAVDDLLGMQMTSNDTTLSGGVTFTIYDSSTGGTMVYNESFPNNISRGQIDVTLGEDDSNELSLEYGKEYYMNIIAADTDLNFGGNDRQRFQPNIGNITSLDISPNNITSEHIADNAISTASKIVDRIITAIKIVAQSITGDEIADDAINNTHILDGTILPIDVSSDFDIGNYTAGTGMSVLNHVITNLNPYDTLNIVFYNNSLLNDSYAINTSLEENFGLYNYNMTKVDDVTSNLTLTGTKLGINGANILTWLRQIFFDEESDLTALLDDNYLGVADAINSTDLNNSYAQIDQDETFTKNLTVTQDVVATNFIGDGSQLSNVGATRVLGSGILWIENATGIAGSNVSNMSIPAGTLDEKDIIILEYIGTSDPGISLLLGASLIGKYATGGLEISGAISTTGSRLGSGRITFLKDSLANNTLSSMLATTTDVAPDNTRTTWANTDMQDPDIYSSDLVLQIYGKYTGTGTTNENTSISYMAYYIDG